MSRYGDTVRDQHGRTLSGVKVYVYTSNEVLATLTDDAGAPLANPVTTDQYGNYHFNAPRGVYILEFRVGPKLVLRREAVGVGDNLSSLLKGDPGPTGPSNNTHGTRAGVAGSPTSNGTALLIERGREGLFAWDAAAPVALHQADTAQGLYIAPSATAAGAWVRQFDGPINPQWFGFVADYNRDTGVGTDNLAAFNALKTLLTARTIAGWSTFERGGDPVEVPKGRYYFSGPLEFKGFTIRFTGEGVGHAGGDATQFYFPPNTDGIRVQTHNTQTTGVEPAGSTNTIGSDGCHFEGIFLQSQDGSTTGSGFVLRARAAIVNCKAFNFGRDGATVAASAGAGGTQEGNANSWYFENCRFNHNGRAGLFIDGADVNAGTAINVTGDYNGTTAIWESSFLGNLFIGCHSDSNGQVRAGNGGNTAVLNATGQVVHNGRAYHVRRGQAAGASINAPSGTDASNQWWGFMFATTDVGGTFPAWVSGIATKEGAAYISEDSNARSTWLACYSEGGQPPAYMMSPVKVEGGLHGAGFTRDSTAAIGDVEGGRLIYRNGVGGSTGRARGISATIGGDDSGGVLNVFDPNFAPNGFRLKVDGGNIRADHGNSDASRLLHWTGQGTTDQFGTGAPVRDAAYFHKLMVGADLGSGRLVTNGTSAPSTGAHAWGEIVLNRDPVAGSALGWRCTAAGTPGTWEAINLGGGTAGTTDPEIVRDTIAAALRAGPNVTIVHDDLADTITISAAAGAGEIAPVATRSDMAALPVPAAAGKTVVLTEAGREGVFMWDPTVPAVIHQLDNLRGVYVAPSATTAGAWVRQLRGSQLIATWFGARAAGTAFDNGPAIRAMKALAQVWNGDGGTRKTNQLYELHFPPATDEYYFSSGTPATAAIVDGAFTVRPAQPAQPGVVCEITDAFKVTGIMSATTRTGTRFLVATGLTMFAFISAEHPNSAHGAGLDGISIRAVGKSAVRTLVTNMPLKASGDPAQTDITVADSSQFKVGDLVRIPGMYVRTSYKNRSAAFTNRVATTAGQDTISFPAATRFRGGEVVTWDGAGFPEGSYVKTPAGSAEGTVFQMVRRDAAGAEVPALAANTVSNAPGYIYCDFATQIRAIPNATTITLADGIYNNSPGMRGIGITAGFVPQQMLEKFDSAVYTECQVIFGTWAAFDFKGAGFFATGNTSLKSRTGRDTNANESLISGKYTTGNCFTGVLMMGSDCNGIAFYGFNGRQSDSWGFIDASGTGCRSFGGHYAGTLGLYVATPTAKSMHYGYKETGTDYLAGGAGPEVGGTGWGSNPNHNGFVSHIVDDSGRRVTGPMKPYGNFPYDWTIGDQARHNGILRLNAQNVNAAYSAEFIIGGISDYAYPGANNGLVTVHDNVSGVALQGWSMHGATNGRGKVWFPLGLYLGTGDNLEPQRHRLVVMGSAIPTGPRPTGDAWVAGDTIENIAPAAGGFKGWVCITGGNPGVWRTYGAISA